jgi:ADP-ribose pyrophosphatase YjhB (NUDIX family)
MPQKSTPFLAVYLLFKKENQVLLLRRFKTGFMDGSYSLVAGHVDEGESFVTASSREAMEEAGVEIEPENLNLAYTLHRKSEQKHGDRVYVDLFFEVNAWTGELQNMEPDKCDDLTWFELESLPENMIDYIRFTLEQIKLGKTFGEFGW